MEVLQRKTFAPVVVIALIGAGLFFLNQGFRKESKAGNKASGELNNITSTLIKLPDTVSFAGEKMPLEYFDTRESLEREIIITAYRHSSTIMIIKRSTRYFPVIEKILKEYNIPDDFKYLAAAESDLSNLVSPKGATGFWQIMP